MCFLDTVVNDFDRRRNDVLAHLLIYTEQKTMSFIVGVIGLSLPV